MKKSHGIYVLLVVFAMGFVSAANCNNDQIIIRLSSETNGHAAAWNDTNYDYSVCYSDIFGVEYPGANTHPTSCTQPVLWLSGKTNAHASATYLIGEYDVPVCYGDLNCHSTIGSCNPGEQITARLRYLNNSHISIASDTSYPVKICCNSNLPAFWADMSEDPITFSPVNAYVKMGAQGLGIIIYTLEKKNGNSWNFVKNVSKTADTGITFGIWFVDASGIYRFRAGNYISNELNVSGERDSTIPEVDFVSPACGSDFFINDTLEIVVNITDRYDPLSGTIDFGDGTNSTLSQGINTFTHKYSANGTKKMIVGVADLAEGFIINKINNIIIINNRTSNSYIAGCIASPKNAGRLPTNLVRFNASTTRALDFDAVTQTKTELSLANNVKFTWTLSDIGNAKVTIVFFNDSYFKSHSVRGPIENVTSGARIRGYDFSALYPTSGYNWAKMSVELV